MSFRARVAFLAVAAAQVVFPVGLAAYNEVRLAFGYDVRLHVEPVDPTDPFRGEYVDLSYDVSQVALDGPLPAGTRVYVRLHEEGDRWTGKRGQLTKPLKHPFIRGRLSHSLARGERTAQLSYGIETYFVEEGRSIEYERAINRQELYADVALDGDGKARIKRLVVVPRS